MPVDLPTTLNLMKLDLATVNEALNGLRNIECADESPEDADRIQAAIATYEAWWELLSPIVANYALLGEKGYPIFPTFPVSLAMKARLQAETKASTAAEALFIGTRSAVSGTLNFSRPLAQKP